jgi:hypothetical protein
MAADVVDDVRWRRPLMRRPVRYVRGKPSSFRLEARAIGGSGLPGADAFQHVGHIARWTVLVQFRRAPTFPIMCFQVAGGENRGAGPDADRPGVPGGKRTGQRVTHYIVPDGPYTAAYAKLKQQGHQLSLAVAAA